jgi:hypothetical protein
MRRPGRAAGGQAYAPSLNWRAASIELRLRCLLRAESGVAGGPPSSDERCTVKHARSCCPVVRAPLPMAGPATAGSSVPGVQARASCGQREQPGSPSRPRQLDVNRKWEHLNEWPLQFNFRERGARPTLANKPRNWHKCRLELLAGHEAHNASPYQRE